LFVFFLKKHYQKEDNEIEDENISKKLPKNNKDVIVDSVIALATPIITIIGVSFVLQITEIVVTMTGVSNIINPLEAIGVGAIISTYFVPRPLILWDLP